MRGRTERGDLEARAVGRVHAKGALGLEPELRDAQVVVEEDRRGAEGDGGAEGGLRLVHPLALEVEVAQLVAGERRWRAAQRARLHTIPAIVRALDQREIMALALIENLQREDLNPLEEARAYQKLSEDEGMTQAEIAKLVDKSRSHVANFQRLLALPDDVLDMLADGRLSMGHARPLIGNEEASELANRAVNDNLSVREVEKLARGEKPKKNAQTKKPNAAGEGADDPDIAAVQGHLEEFLGLAVRIKPEGAPGNGTVTISYRTLDQLDLICQRLTGGDI